MELQDMSEEKDFWAADHVSTVTLTRLSNVKMFLCYVPHGPIGLNILLEQVFSLLTAFGFMKTTGHPEHGRAQLLLGRSLLLSPCLDVHQRTKIIQDIILCYIRKRQ